MKHSLMCQKGATMLLLQDCPCLNSECKVAFPTACIVAQPHVRTVSVRLHLASAGVE